MFPDMGTPAFPPDQQTKDQENLNQLERTLDVSMNHQQILTDDYKTLEKKVTKETVGEINGPAEIATIDSDPTMSGTEVAERAAKRYKRRQNETSD